ncbi:tumor necrosis factor receptor superfamily member 1A-like [Gastrophryne carolinensis]
MDSPNSSPKCFACSDCLRQNGQIELYSCVKEKDTQCGCQENHYKRGKGTDDSRFECEECSTCLNGTIIRPCSENEDTICLCNPNFFFDKSERMCRHCPVICESPECIDCPKPEGSRKHLETQEVLWIVVSVALVLVFLATTACAVQYFRDKPQSQLFPDITGKSKPNSMALTV